MIHIRVFSRRNEMMQHNAMLTQLGYTPNEALVEQLERIIANTHDYIKIEKHILDLHNHLKVDSAYVALSNSEDYFKIKIEAQSDDMINEAYAKIGHFADKYKVALEQVAGKNTYYILGFQK